MEHYKPQMNNMSSGVHDDFFEFRANPMSASASSPNSMYPTPVPSTASALALGNLSTSSSYDNDTLQQLKTGFVKMMSSMERLEQRIARMERTTDQILKNQQEVLQVPFMSQTEIDKARQVAEQLEQDVVVAKQLQAAYNTEVELKKSITASQYQSRGYPQQNNRQSMSLSECPICGVRVNQHELEAHVDQCLELFSNDPKKEVQVQDAKKKMETGFFGRLFKTTKTETTKVTTTQSASAPLLQNQQNETSTTPMYPGFGYPQYTPMYPGMNPTSNSSMQPMMMPMYMPYPSYPHMNQSNE